MPQPSGTNCVVAIFDETTYATDPGAPDGQMLYVVSSGVRPQQNLQDSNTLTGARARARPTRGNIDVSGSIEVELSAENHGKLLKHAMGLVNTTGAGPYTHVLTLGALPVGMAIEHDYSSAISGAGRYEKFNGCRVSSFSVSIPTEGAVTASFDIRGAKSTLGATALDGTLTDTGHTPFSSFQASILEGGIPIATVTAVELQVNNDLDDSVFAIGGQGTRRALPEGFASVTGQITALFEDASLLNKALNDTASSLKLTLSRGTGVGTAGNESIEIEVQNLVYELTGPGVPGPRGLQLQMPFRAYRLGGDNGLKVTIKNAIATL
jgi:hypothetical protein